MQNCEHPCLESDEQHEHLGRVPKDEHDKEHEFVEVVEDDFTNQGSEDLIPVHDRSAGPPADGGVAAVWKLASVNSFIHKIIIIQAFGH